MTGLRILVGLALKRDRLMIPAWVLGLGAAVVITASSYSNLYETESSRRDSSSPPRSRASRSIVSPPLRFGHSVTSPGT